jgi:HK97 family phage major capsid protein
MLREGGIEDLAAEPSHKYSRTIPLPDDRLLRALGVGGSAATGGDLVVSSVARVAEAARPALALDLIGVERITVSGHGPFALPSWDPEATVGSWVGEGSAGATPALTVHEVETSPKQAIASVTLSRRLVKAVDQIENDVLAEIRRATAATIESGFLNGLGGLQPLGLLNTPGAQVQTWLSTSPSRAELVLQMKDYANAHGSLSRARWLMNSNLAASMLTTEVSATSGQFVLSVDPGGRPLIMGIPAVIADHLPDGRLLLLDPSTVKVVYWGNPYALANPFANDVAGDLRLTVYNACDIACLQPAQITIGRTA